MATTFLHSKLWDKISALASTAKHRWVAVAYLGTGASELLPLGVGDVLVVDMSLAAIRSGQTNPYEIEKYIRSKVEVHSRSSLHAKVFVFDGKAIIGSANVSRNSQHKLVETAVITTDKDVVRDARGFVFSLRGEYVTPAYVKSCKREYHPSKPPVKADNSYEPTLWIQRTHTLKRDDSKRDKAIVNGSQAAKKRLQSKKRYCTEWETYPTSSMLAQQAKLNDLYIQIWRDEDGEPLLVYPPSRVIGFKEYSTELDFGTLGVFCVECVDDLISGNVPLTGLDFFGAWKHL